MSGETVTPEQSYEAARSTVAGALATLDAVTVTGPDAQRYLQGQVSQDLTPLEVGSSTEALVLSPQGKLDAYVRIARTADDALVVAVDEGFGQLLYDRLRRFKLRVKAELELVSRPVVVLRGPGSDEVAAGIDGIGLVVAWPGVVGIDIFGSDVALAKGITPLTAEALEALRIETGQPMMGRELTEKSIAQETGLTARTVSFTKGCYTGQELVARIDARGENVARRLRGLLAAEPVEVGSELLDATGKVVGAVTSAAFSPRLSRTVALGYVGRAVVPPAELSVASGSGTRPVSVIELPFS